jgi:hypothetical protein
MSSASSALGQLHPKQKDDPVAKMQRYKEQWKKDAKVRQKSADAVKQIREKMMQKPVTVKKTKPSVPVAYEACPKRENLRWEMRVCLIKCPDALY